MFYRKMRILLTLLCSAGCVCSAYAQGGKKLTTVVKAATQSSEKTLLKGASQNLGRLPAVSSAAAQAAGRQLTIRFPGDPVQLEIPFETESAPLDKALSQRVAQQVARQLPPPASLQEVHQLPSGETARLVRLEAKHFKKTHQLKATTRYLMKTMPKPVRLVSQKTGKQIIVVKNDRLRYFSDVEQACPAGSYLILHEDGKAEFLTPEQAPKNFAETYEKAYAQNNPSPFLDISFERAGASYKIQELKSLASLFDPSLGFGRVYDLPAHPINGQPVQVIVLSSPARVEGIGLLRYDSMVVRYADGSFDVHPADWVPPVLQDKIASLTPKRATPISISLSGELSMEPAPKRFYDGQADLARDLHQAFKGQGKPYTSLLMGDFIVYEIPAGIVYHPAGRAEELLNPQKQVIIYFPSSNRGQIIDRSLLDKPVFATPVK